MVFASQLFLFAFLPAVILLYYAGGKWLRASVLLLASYIFYAWGAPRFVFILLGASYFDFIFAKLIFRQQDPKQKKRLLTVSVAVNLGLLGYFKYAGFFTTLLAGALAGIWHSPNWLPLKVALPIGISFFTFHKLSYVIDVYRGTCPPMKRFSLFALYVAFFPQLVAGPIVRYNQISEQLLARVHSLDKFFDGVTRLCFGLGKKMLIANVLGSVADRILAPGVESPACSAAWLAMLCYTFQIYFDFSGYSDMAVGMGKMFGFTLPENFNQPYIARSITEFWRRWHMSLSNWFKDYLYIPLGGNRVSPGRTYLNLWIVFFLCGLWHGAAWSFVIWGCYHGLWLVIERSFLGKHLERAPAFLTRPWTFLLVVIGWVFFRANGIAQAFSLLSSMFSFSEASRVAMEPYLNSQVVFTLAAAVGLSFHAAFRDSLPRLMERVLLAVGRNVWARGLASMALFLLSWGSLSASSFNPFIYYRF
jgi:alginate O-acetyltransferase complex protein AlgI